MTLAAKDRPWWKTPEWKGYFKDSWTNKEADQYGYIKGVEKIRDLTDSEYWFAKAYDEMVGK